MNLAGYIRVSTEGQVDAYGKDVQQGSIERWASLNGHEITAWFEEDAVSGKTDGGDRPMLSQILTRSDEFDGVVAFDATRLARRSLVQETLLNLVWATGLRVFTTTAGELAADEDDPTKIMIRQILGIIAEFDHRTTVKKLQAARAVKSSRGGYIGGTPKYGTAVQGTGKNSVFVPDVDERKALQKIRRWRRQGFSLRDIADRLNEESVPTKTKSGRWYASQVSRAVKRSED